MLKISASYFRDAVCLLPNVVSGIAGVDLRWAWVRPATACVTTYFDYVFCNGKFSGKTLRCWRLYT